MKKHDCKRMLRDKIKSSPDLSLIGPYRSTADEYKKVLQEERRILQHVSTPSRELTKYYRKTSAEQKN